MVDIFLLGKKQTHSESAVLSEQTVPFVSCHPSPRWAARVIDTNLRTGAMVNTHKMDHGQES